MVYSYGVHCKIKKWLSCTSFHTHACFKNPLQWCDFEWPQYHRERIRKQNFKVTEKRNVSSLHALYIQLFEILLLMQKFYSKCPSIISTVVTSSRLLIWLNKAAHFLVWHVKNQGQWVKKPLYFSLTLSFFISLQISKQKICNWHALFNMTLTCLNTEL
jgi:hypothetical protein